MYDDKELAEHYPFHNKIVLCELLNQKYLKLDPGTWWIKPAISWEGLGYAAHRYKYLNSPIVIMAEATGRYLNVDAYRTGEVHVWSAQREGTFFDWFCLEPGGKDLLSRVQRDKVETLAKTTALTAVINCEFIGDTMIEAHARPSHELDHMLKIEAPEGERLYWFPIWRHPHVEHPDDPAAWRFRLRECEDRHSCKILDVRMLTDGLVLDGAVRHCGITISASNEYKVSEILRTIYKEFPRGKVQD